MKTLGFEFKTAAYKRFTNCSFLIFIPLEYFASALGSPLAFMKKFNPSRNIPQKPLKIYKTFVV